MLEQIELTILMPCLNEAETLGVCITKAQSFLQTASVNGEILIADNGSTDGSQEIALTEGARLINVVDRGYGSALIAGIRESRGSFVIMGDADDSYDFTNLQPFLDQLRQGSDLVMGNRFQGGIEKGAMPILHRYLGNPVLSRIGRLFFGIKVGDFHCGLRGFNREAIDGLHLKASGMEFASEMVVKSRLLGLEITEVPTRLSPDGRTRPPHLNTWRDGWRHLRFLILYSPRWAFLYPGVFLILFSTTLAMLIEFSVLQFGNVGFGIGTLLVLSGSFLAGVQAVSFGILAKIYGINEGLLPHDDRIEKWENWVRLEVWLTAGVVLMLVGLIGVVFQFLYWKNSRFGQLNPVDSIKIIAPAITACVAGFQVFSSGIFLGVMKIGRNNR